tara:strand:+ start:209 stop:427 length:219 start_codon:yes stop_codon:yes gene_type:complete
MMTTKKLASGHFEVFWNDLPTEYSIVNGSLGQSGNEPNFYGITNKITGKINWQGSIQKCKKLVQFTLEKRNK